MKSFISFKVHVPSLCHCGGKAIRSVATLTVT
nr:MAG TPA: hypothetical protein [Caudoviricetes sp.]